MPSPQATRATQKTRLAGSGEYKPLPGAAAAQSQETYASIHYVEKVEVAQSC